MKLTIATAVVIFFPPDAPLIILTLFLFVSHTMVGLMDDRGRLPGSIKLFRDGGEPKLVVLGTEKSAISLLNTMPVRLPFILPPKLERNYSFDFNSILEKKITKL